MIILTLAIVPTLWFAENILAFPVGKQLKALNHRFVSSRHRQMPCSIF